MDSSTELAFLQELSDLEMTICGKLASIRQMIISGKRRPNSAALPDSSLGDNAGDKGGSGSNHSSSSSNGNSNGQPAPVRQQGPPPISPQYLLSPTPAPISNLKVPLLPQFSLPPAPTPISNPKAPLLQQFSLPPTPAPISNPKVPLPSPFSLPPTPVPALPLLGTPSEKVVFPYFYNSRNFFVQTDAAKAEALNEKLNASYIEELNIGKDARLRKALSPEVIVPQQTVCVFNTEEGAVYRGEVLKINQEDETYFVRYIDFGDLVKVKADCIMMLAYEFTTEEPMAVSCYLDGKWDQNMTTLESAMFSFIPALPNMKDPIEAVRVTILHPGINEHDLDKNYPGKYPAVVEVKIKQKPGMWMDLMQVPAEYFGGKPVVEAVQRHTFDIQVFIKSCSDGLLNWDQRSPAGYLALTEAVPLGTFPQLKIGEQLTGAHVDCISRFMLVAKGTADLVTNLSNFYRGYFESLYFKKALNGELKRTGKLVVFAVGLFFFRGLVLKATDPKEVEVYAIDLGFTTSVRVADLRPLILPLFSLERLPPKAVVVGLDGIVSPYGGGQWQVITIQTLKSFVVGQPVVPLTSRFKAGTYLVELQLPKLPKDNQKATELLKMFKLANPV